MKKALIVFLLIFFTAQAVLAGVNWRQMAGYAFTGDQYQALEIVSIRSEKVAYVKDEMTLAFKMQDYEEVIVYPKEHFDYAVYGPVEQEIVDQDVVAVWDLQSECGDPPYKARKYTVQKGKIKVEWYWFFDTCNNHNINTFDVVEETPVPTPEVTPPPNPSTTPEPTPPPPTEEPKPPSVVGKVPSKGLDEKMESKWDAASNAVTIIFVITPDQPTCKPTEEPPTCDPNGTPPPTPPPQPTPPPTVPPTPPPTIPPPPVTCNPTPPPEITTPDNTDQPITPPDGMLINSIPTDVNLQVAREELWMQDKNKKSTHF